MPRLRRVEHHDRGAGECQGKQERHIWGCSKVVPLPISQIETRQETRLHMPSEELNRVLGGGLVAGSIVLIGGEPGIGKSTLVLQNILSIRGKRILYVSGEESASQLKMRADRIGRLSDNCYIVCDTSLENILGHIKQVEPELVVVDSIQTIASDAIESSAGSVSQVRECAAQLRRNATRRFHCGPQGAGAHCRCRASV